MRKITVLIVFILGFNLVEAQNWVSLAGANNGYNGSVLCSDSITGKLFVGGDLITTDGHQSWEIATWDGTNWDTTYSFRTYGGGRITTITRYLNDLYVCGWFSNAFINIQ